MNEVSVTRKATPLPGTNSVTGDGDTRFLAYMVSGSVFWRRCLLVAATLLAVFNLSCAHAGHITIATQFSVTQAADGPVLAVTIQNRGDVSAQAVQIEVSVEGDSLVGPVIDKLAVDESTSAEFTLADRFQSPGRYPLVIRTFYKDKAGHRFTALIVGFYTHQTANTPDVFIEGQAATVPIDGRGSVVFVLRNEGNTTRVLDLELHLPEELSASRRRAVVEVAANGEDTVVFHLDNYSALSNSRYPVTLVGRYQQGGHSYGVAGTATIRLGEETPVTTKPTWIWFVLAGLLPLVIVLLRLYERRAGHQTP